MCILLTYKLTNKTLAFKNQLKKAPKFPKQRKKPIQKFKKFHKKYVQNGI